MWCVVDCRDSGIPNAEGRESRNPTESISRYSLKRGSVGCVCLGSLSISPVLGRTSVV